MMPTIVPSVPTRGVSALANNLGFDARQRLPIASNIGLEAIASERRRFDRLANSIVGFAENQKAKREAREAAKHGSGGAIGAGAGAALAVALAPVTGGASLAFLPALTAGGAAIGEAVDPVNPSQGTTAGRDFVNAGNTFARDRRAFIAGQRQTGDNLIDNPYAGLGDTTAGAALHNQGFVAPVQVPFDITQLAPVPEDSFFVNAA